MKRIFYALQKGWENRVQLKAHLTQPALQLNTLNELTPAMIEAGHVAVVVLDFDGVLAPHDSDKPTPESEAWLKRLSVSIGEQRIAILTNKAKPQRITYFQQYFPGIQVVVGVAKKPYPDGLWEIANYRGIDSSRLLLIDDRLLTGMLAACLAPCQARYFRRPLRDYAKNPIREIFFSSLRTLERFIIRLVA